MNISEREKSEVVVEIVGWDVKIVVCSEDQLFNLLARSAAAYEGSLYRGAAILAVFVLQLVIAVAYLLFEVEAGTVLLGVLVVPFSALAYHHWQGVQFRESFKAFKKARDHHERQKRDQDRA